MREARERGRRRHPNTEINPPDQDAIDIKLRELEAQRRRYSELIQADDLRQLSRDLVTRLEACNVDLSAKVDREQVRLTTLIDYAQERAHARYARMQNEFNSNFGMQELAATKMGNVANSIQTYAVRRYHCNFEVIWSNLQHSIQKDDKAQTALAEVKSQLDFLIACCWLSLLSTALWVVLFGAVEPSRLGFRLAALIGPPVAYLWYRAAAEQYRSFADIVMTALDTFRFALLDEMKLARPNDVEDERHMWENIDKLTTYGEARNFRYQFPKS
jgi:hypothetical protein